MTDLTSGVGAPARSSADRETTSRRGAAHRKSVADPRRSEREGVRREWRRFDPLVR
jgi:hypothetical protein